MYAPHASFSPRRAIPGDPRVAGIPFIRQDTCQNSRRTVTTRVASRGRSRSPVKQSKQVGRFEEVQKALRYHEWQKAMHLEQMNEANQQSSFPLLVKYSDQHQTALNHPAGPAIGAHGQNLLSPSGKERLESPHISRLHLPVTESNTHEIKEDTEKTIRSKSQVIKQISTIQGRSEGDLRERKREKKAPPRKSTHKVSREDTSNSSPRISSRRRKIHANKITKKDKFLQEEKKKSPPKRHVKPPMVPKQPLPKMPNLFPSSRSGNSISRHRPREGGYRSYLTARGPALIESETERTRRLREEYEEKKELAQTCSLFLHMFADTDDMAVSSSVMEAPERNVKWSPSTKSVLHNPTFETTESNDASAFTDLKTFENDGDTTINDVSHVTEVSSIIAAEEKSHLTDGDTTEASDVSETLSQRFLKVAGAFATCNQIIRPPSQRITLESSPDASKNLLPDDNSLQESQDSAGSNSSAASR